MTLDAPLPLRYTPAVEKIDDDENETLRGLLETLAQIRETTYADGGHALRSVHAKSHGLLEGEFEVDSGLPETLAQGLFAKPGRYPVVMRLSTIPGDILDDSVSTPRGLAIKALGVSGERLPGSEGDTTQDFVLVNAPAFSAPNTAAFLKNLKMLAAMTDKAPGLKKALSSVMRGVESLIESASQPSPTVVTLGGQPETHILGETFYSQAPLRFGDYIAKIAVAPVSPDLTALSKAPLDVNGVPNGLREAVVSFFAAHGGEWEVRAQLCVDLGSMPVEDASKKWPEDQSPYRTVGRIRVQPQSAWSEERSRRIDDGMAFSPWHGLLHHRPLGSIMRARKQTYEASAVFRGEHNGCPMREPKGAAVR